jgi:hypothetical protein
MRWRFAIALLLAQGCAGPRPEVIRIALVSPGGPGAPYRVEATIHNRGSEGQVDVRVRLHDRASGVAFQAGRKLELRSGEVGSLVVELPAPPGSYAPEVEAQYPPR